MPKKSSTEPAANTPFCGGNLDILCERSKDEIVP
jgi:hypothetical protein